MIFYSISSLLELSNKMEGNISFPFLESFFGSYSQKVTENQKIPLFSKTTKYNNFPVRCKWKSSDKKSENKNCGEDREVKDVKSPIKEWRKESEPLMIPTKIQKVSGIKGLAIKVLNKITETNFEVQSTELLKVLCENKEKMSVAIISNLILEKIWYDKSFYRLYVNLCKKLWENNEWVSECYEVSYIQKGKKKEYFYTLSFESKQSLKGPFKTNELAKEKAIKMANFKTVFVALCRDNFYRREEFIKEMVNMPDSNQKYKLKRRLFGTIEILGHIYEMGYLEESIIHYLLLSLLHPENKGSKYEEELETMKLLWDIVYKKIGSKKNEYKNLLKQENKKNWSSRIKFMISDMISNISTISAISAISTIISDKVLENTEDPDMEDPDIEDPDIEDPDMEDPDMEVQDIEAPNTEVKDIKDIEDPDIEDPNMEDPDIEDPDIEDPDMEVQDIKDIEDPNIEDQDIKDIENKSKEFNSFKKYNDKSNENIENDITNLSRKFNIENKKDIFSKLKSKNISSIVTNLIRDSTEYGEYAENHSSTILSFLENYEISKLSFEQLSKAIAKVGEDMCDIKMDAPKAPVNMSLVIGNILKGTKTGKIEININKTTVLSDNINSKKEWDNILRLTENIIDKDTLINRFEILKYNN